MLFRLFIHSLLLASVAPGNTACARRCRSIPGDPAWPSIDDWGLLNHTVGGNLVATTPIAAPCHRTLFDRPNAIFSEDECDALRDVWYFPTTHLPSSSSPMAYPFSNNSCNPFAEPDAPCTIGSLVVYTVNASRVSDFQTAVRFARDYNIRLVIRNTGHDYLGKSTGAHALGLWTHNLKAMDLTPAYKGGVYEGPAITIGAGVLTAEAYSFAHEHGLVVVGGNCPTVGLAEGGGHGPLSSKFGLAADHVLEWEVVTADGEVVTATPVEHPDLFWALRGGGGSTYGVVLSVTVKAFPDMSVSTAYLTVSSNGTKDDALYSSIGTFIQSLPALVDQGAIAIFVVSAEGFSLTPAIAPGLQPDELDRLLQPTVDRLEALGLEYAYSSTSNTSFLAAYDSISTISNVSDQIIGGRFIPRSLVESNETDALVDAIRYITSQGAVFVGNAINVKGGVSSPDDVAANPYFRETLFSATVGAFIDYTDWTTTEARQHAMTHDYLPRLEALTPNGGAYLNEGDVHQPQFKATFYGDHYDRLLDIKKQYDPTGVFYAQTAVGGDLWEQDSDGRLCTV